MVVYTVHQGCKYEGGGLCGVFTTEEKALEYAKDFVDNENAWTESGNDLVRKEHEPGGSMEEFDFYPLPYYVPVEKERSRDVIEYWEAGPDYILVQKYETDPVFEGRTPPT